MLFRTREVRRGKQPVALVTLYENDAESIKAIALDVIGNCDPKQLTALLRALKADIDGRLQGQDEPRPDS